MGVRLRPPILEARASSIFTDRRFISLFCPSGGGNLLIITRMGMSCRAQGEMKKAAATASDVKSGRATDPFGVASRSSTR